MTTVQRKKTPVTRHRLFPVIVALWFAALLGLGSFAVSPALLSQAVAASGLPAIVPAAAPPLGFTAQALVALVLTTVGGLTGFVVGRRIGGRREAAMPRRRAASPVPAVRARDSHPDAPPRQPFSPSEHLPASDPVDSAEPPFPGRRRALAVTDETQPAEHRDIVPVPGGGEVVPLDLSALFAEIESEGAACEEEDPVAEAVAPVSAAEPVGVPPVTASAAAERADEIADQTSEAIAPVPVSAAIPLARLVEPAPRAASPVAAAPLESLGVVQLVERLALAIGEHRQRHPESGAPEALAEALRALGVAGQPVSAPNEARQAVPVAPVVASPPPAPSIARFEKAAPVVSLPVTPAPWIPACEEDEIELPAQAARFLRLETPAAPPSAVPAEAEDEVLAAEEPAAAGYSSLLTVPVMRLSGEQGDSPDEPARAENVAPVARQMFVRVDEPVEAPIGTEPVVIFPGHAAAPAAQGQGESPRQPLVSGQSTLDREEADRALRAALATLQRMSGAR